MKGLEPVLLVNYLFGHVTNNWQFEKLSLISSDETQNSRDQQWDGKYQPNESAQKGDVSD